MNGTVTKYDYSKLENKYHELEIAFTVLKTKLEDHCEATEKALNTALTVVNERLAEMNNMRHQLDRQAGTFLTQEMFDSKIKGLNEKIELIQKMVWIGFGGVTVLITLLQLLMKFVGN